jgi:multiple sugar transport system substrate-binding protein
MQLKRTMGIGVLILMMALVLSACTGIAPQAAAPGGEQAAAGEATTITWAFWGGPAELESANLVADAFMAEHPEIQIELWNQPWDDYFTKIQALWASGDTKVIPDVAFLWPTPRYAAEGVLENLDPFIEASGYDLNDYWPGLLESAKFEGSVYGFPRDIEVNVIYYNKDMFDAAGVAYPADDWTWDDFLAVQFFADLMEQGYAMRPADLNQAGGDAAVFMSGQAAMILQNTSRVSALNAAGMNYDVAPAPIPAGGKRHNGAGGAAWVMSSGSDNKDAAWTFIEWLQSDGGGQTIYTERGEIFPALQSVANSPAFMTDQAPANKQAIITEASASDVGNFGYFPEWGELSGSIIEPGLEKIWAGEVDVETGLADICTQVDQFLADNGYPK